MPLARFDDVRESDHPDQIGQGMTLPLMPTSYGPIRDRSDVEALERIPFSRRLPAFDSYGLIRHAGNVQTEKPAFHYLTTGEVEEAPFTVTYAQFLERIHQAANLFRELGIGPGDVVALLLPNLPETLYALWGGQVAGIVCPINWMLETAQIASILRASRAKVLVSLGPTPGFEIDQKVAGLRSEISRLETVVTVRGPGGMAGGDDFSGLLARRPGQLAFSRDIDPGEVAIYIHTGGTTGTPKVARITHMGLAYQFWVNSWMKGLTHNDRIFSGTPYFHSGGIINVSLVALGNGMTQTILGPMGYRNRRMTDNLWKLVERFGITHLNVVPTIFSVLAANPPADDKCCNFLSRLTMI